MVLASDYPFLDIMGTMLIFFLWMIWIWMIIVLLSHLFSRKDIGGGKKALWTLFMVFLPFLGILCYLISQHDSLAQAREQAAAAQQAQMAAAAPSGPSGEIAKGKELLDSGVITQQEFDALKARALAA